MLDGFVIYTELVSGGLGILSHINLLVFILWWKENGCVVDVKVSKAEDVGGIELRQE